MKQPSELLSLLWIIQQVLLPSLPFPQVTETRTGPLGCSNYDNLDSVSSVLVQSPENKIQLQGM